jgi:hypothetical protein
MKKKIFYITVIFLGVIYVTSCQKELSSEGKNSLIEAGKKWFLEYKQNTQFNAIFKNVDYDWDRAEVQKFPNNYEYIIIPIKEINQNPNYKGARLLFLYPWKKGNGFYTALIEIILNKNEAFKTNDKEILNNLNGYLLSWDLELGFKKGFKYTNGIPVSEIETLKFINLGNYFNPVTQPAPTTISRGVSVVASPQPDGSYIVQFISSNTNYSMLYNWPGPVNNPCEYNSNCNIEVLNYMDVNLFNQLIQEQQALYEDVWVANNVKDSTGNPCASATISGLNSIYRRLPKLITNFFDTQADFDVTFRTDTNNTWVANPNGVNYNAPYGGRTILNYISPHFTVYLNDYYHHQTDLAYAATIIHEIFHCQLMQWFRQAIIDSNQVVKEQLSLDYGYIFTKEMLDEINNDPNNPSNNNLIGIVLGGTATQHENIVTKFKDYIADALYEFATSKGISVSLNYCKDLAWAGTLDSKAFNDLSTGEKDRIVDRINAEKDPNKNLLDPNGDPLNLNFTNKKGNPCN